jgi:4'-phosphopantetheinyl transferase EntD
MTMRQDVQTWVDQRPDRHHAPRLSMPPASMIGALVPLATGVELFGDAPESSLLPSEAAAVEGAMPERRREFATVRACARTALLRIGVPPVAILPDAEGAPRWPAGVVGSLTHCPGYRAAVVARSTVLRGVGIDAEPHAPLPPGMLDYIVRADERAGLRDLAARRPDLHWDRIAFCAKEAVFKAWYPLTRRWLDFSDLSVVLRTDGTFRVRASGGPTGAGITLDVVSGRWMVGRGLILTTATIDHLPAAAPARAA